MIKVYRKTATIKAEQFDGSDEMINKYHIELDHAYGCPFRLETLDGWLGVNVHDWIFIGVNGEHWPITNDVFKKTYAELPVIPGFVAEYIDDMKSKGKDIWDAMHYILRPENVDGYMQDNSETFARAWLDEFQTEEK